MARIFFENFLGYCEVVFGGFTKWGGWGDLEWGIWSGRLKNMPPLAVMRFVYYAFSENGGDRTNFIAF